MGKLEDEAGIKVDESRFRGTRCFWVMREDGSCEDFSMVKIYQHMDAIGVFASATGSDTSAILFAPVSSPDAAGSDIDASRSSTVRVQLSPWGGMGPRQTMLERVVATRVLVLRQGADLDSKVIGKLPSGGEAFVLEAKQVGDVMRYLI